MIALFILGAMVALSIIYFNDVGFKSVLKFWGAYLLGFALLFVPLAWIEYIMLAYHGIVVLIFFAKAKASA